MEILTIPEFLGHLHPVLVHLPIGILLIGCFFILVSRKEKYAHLRSSITVIFFWGMISAVLSCITGYILSGAADYDPQLVFLHQWMGISVAVISVITYFSGRRPVLSAWQFPLALLLLAFLVVTGHLGGSLTHGSDYLTKPILDLGTPGEGAVVKRKPIPDIQQALVYGDLVQPILEAKCYSCHGPNKQKGKLRVDQPASLMKGGKDGAVIEPGKAAESELIKRILLPREEEHHMPPKEKSQLSEKETSLLQWWISEGADFGKRVRDLDQPEKIKPILKSLQNDTAVKQADAGIPHANIRAADPAAIARLREKGGTILPVSRNSNYLSGNFISDPGLTDEDIRLLLPLKEQLVWLKLGNTIITDSAMAIIAACKHLSKLSLDHTAITDRGMEKLQDLKELMELNLVGTKITSAGILSLKGLKKLQEIFIFQSGVDLKTYGLLKQTFPKTTIDTGGYRTIYIKSDTMINLKPVLQQ